MICRYSTNAICKCPVDGALDVYGVEITAPVMLKVEDINDALAGLRDKTMFQEDLTSSLAKALGATVKTTGTHSGVYTEVSAP